MYAKDSNASLKQNGHNLSGNSNNESECLSVWYDNRAYINFFSSSLHHACRICYSEDLRRVMRANMLSFHCCVSLGVSEGCVHVLAVLGLVCELNLCSVINCEASQTESSYNTFAL